VVKPAGKRNVARWAEQAFQLSERHACRLISIDRSTRRYQSRSDPQTALRRRLRELAASRVRWGYRRLTVMLRREGWPVNAKRIYRLYTEEGLTVTRPQRKKLVRRDRTPQPPAERVNQRWAMDFVSDRLVDGRRSTLSGLDAGRSVYPRMPGTVSRALDHRTTGRRRTRHRRRTPQRAGNDHRRQRTGVQFTSDGGVERSCGCRVGVHRTG
jgi:transposase InsO family protein